MAESNAILLTAPGASAIAVIRARGPSVADFLRRHFSTRPRDGGAVHGTLRDGDREIDDPLVTWNSATLTVDICTHGGTWVVHEVLALLARSGFAVLSPGVPLPDLAVDADDLIEQEILQWLPAARTREAIQTLLNQQQAWREADLKQPEVRQRMLADRSLHYLLHPPRIAIIGIPNAGKSSLANRLFGQDRSIVADLPGTTRDYVSEFANLGGLPVELVDTPGLRSSQCILESAAIAASQGPITTADLQLLLLDPTQPRAPQADLAARYPQALLISGKADLGTTWEGIAISATTGAGLGDLEQQIRAHFGCRQLPHARPCLWTARQHRVIEE